MIEKQFQQMRLVGIFVIKLLVDLEDVVDGEDSMIDSLWLTLGMHFLTTMKFHIFSPLVSQPHATSARLLHGSKRTGPPTHHIWKWSVKDALQHLYGNMYVKFNVRRDTNQKALNRDLFRNPRYSSRNLPCARCKILTCIFRIEMGHICHVIVTCHRTNEIGRII